MAGATCFRLLATILLLAMAGRCYSQQMDHIQLSRTADSIDNLTEVVQVASEKVASGIMKMFTLMATDLAKGHDTYIGLSDLQEEGTYRWVADGTIHQIVESWWCKGEPNNYNGEDCIHYHSSNEGLNDASCGLKFRYICEKPAHLGWNFASVLDEETSTEK